jgi:lysine 2,3-aminomutase
MLPEWKRILRDSVCYAKDLAPRLGLEPQEEAEIREVIKRYPMRVNSYYLSLIKGKGDAIWKQCVPSVEELHDLKGFEDPLAEERDSPVPGLVHRYPDRVLLMVSNYCAMYCRFCTRKRRVGDPRKYIPRSQILEGIQYIREHREVRDVIISGGDPLLLEDSQIEFVLKNLRAIPHVEIIRIGTRVPVTLPQRITPELCDMLKRYHPLYINTHFNHPDEITEESSRACNMLADAGMPLGNQTVLLKGVNDNPKVIKRLMQKLLTIRVKPYYIYQADLTKGTAHFKTKVKDSIAVIEALRGHTSGLAVPHLIIDAPGGGGKIPITPQYVLSMDDEKVVMRNYRGNLYEYRE